QLLCRGRIRAWRGSATSRGRGGVCQLSKVSTAAEHHHDGNRGFRLGQRHERHLDVHVGGREGGIIDVAYELFSDDRMRTYHSLNRLSDGPSHFRPVLWDASEDLAIEVFQDFGPALIPPRLR